MSSNDLCQGVVVWVCSWRRLSKTNACLVGTDGLVFFKLVLVSACFVPLHQGLMLGKTELMTFMLGITELRILMLGWTEMKFLMLSKPSEAVSLTGEFTFDVNLTCCGAPDAALTAALAVDFGVTATVAQSMQVMAFFLSDTTTGGTTSNGTTTTNATTAENAVTPHSPTVTTIYLSGVAELTVELRPVDEGNQLQCLCAQLKTRLRRHIC